MSPPPSVGDVFIGLCGYAGKRSIAPTDEQVEQDIVPYFELNVTDEDITLSSGDNTTLLFFVTSCFR